MSDQQQHGDAQLRHSQFKSFFYWKRDLNMFND